MKVRFLENLIYFQMDRGGKFAVEFVQNDKFFAKKIEKFQITKNTKNYKITKIAEKKREFIRKKRF